MKALRLRQARTKQGITGNWLRVFSLYIAIILLAGNSFASTYQKIVTEEIKILTFNVQRHDNSLFSRFGQIFSHSAPALTRARALIVALNTSDADIIALQEVTPSLLKLLQQQDRQHAWLEDYHLEHTFREMQLSESYSLQEPIGLVILSRYPVSRTTIEPLKNSRLARKYLQVSIQINGASMLLTNIHLDSFSEDGEIRVAQLQQVSEASRHSSNAIILGDYNFTDHQNPESRHLPEDYIDVWPALHRDKKGLTYTSPEESGRLDRLLIRSENWEPVKTELFEKTLFVYENNQYSLSDHRAVITTIRVK